MKKINYSQLSVNFFNKTSLFTIILSVLLVSDVFAGSDKTASQSKDWTIVATYTIPGKASGLAFDGTFLYFGIYGADGDHVYKFDPSNGTNELLFVNPQINDSYGMTFDGTHLWITDHGTSSSVPAYALQLDFSGNILSQFDLPDHYMSGIAYDNGDFWVATYYPDPGTIYKVDNTGAVLIQIPSPEEQPWDLCLQGDDLWVADYYAYMLYKIDQSGTILESHACENERPAGVVYDGQYLWYVDGTLGANSTLYKVDLGGTGTPQINVPVTSYNYGNIAVGDSAVWYCDISSTGTADLIIENLIIQSAVPIFVYMSFPQTIPSGSTLQIPFIYKPTETGTLNTIVTVESNDPVSPQVDLTLEGEAVYDGPHINVPVTSHNYGNIRMNATTRWFVEIENDGSQQLEITDITIDDPHFYLDDNVSFPIYINVLEIAEVGIWFNPDQANTFSAIAEISHNDLSQGPVQVSLSGTGIDQEYPIGDNLWHYTITTSWDNSVKAITPVPDVTGDGVADVIVCSEDDYVRCFNGNSSGLADIIWENEAGKVYGQNGLVIIEDINNDGYHDVIAGLAWGVRAVKALSGKTGELIWIYDTHVYGDGGWVYQVWTGYDYNDDGIDDVLASTGNDGNNTGPKRVFCLDGTSGNPVWDAYTDGPNFSVIGVEDFTGDDKPDVIGGASDNYETEGKVYGINGETGSISWTFTTSGTSVWALEQLDDINGDGIKDIIAGDFAGHYYLLNPANGSTINSGTIGTSIILRFERLDDVNNDGYADIAVAHSGSNAVVINGYSGQNIWLTALADKCWNIDRIEDITGDGINDLIAGTLYSNNYCYFLDGTNGDEIYSLNFGEAVDGISAIPDITGDGSMEMVAGGRDGKLYCYSGGLNSVTLIADFVADTTFGHVPFDVHFTDLTTGNVTSWEWDFDNDGTIDSYQQNPTYTYNLMGTYTVMLIASDGTVTDTAIKADYITADSTVNIQNSKEHFELKIAPNPFSDGTTISFYIKENFPVSLEVYNTEGVKVTTLILSENPGIGLHSVYWEGTNNNGQRIEKGIYLGQLKYGNKTVVTKLILAH
ncbi:MAG: choice-of-anchor D domain-containing protein [Bacteroidetes bacterium]|nr:choice-of-anchor D domain-containing protein [Bacteroidota bacterium]MBL7105696.1 choice-of-anchor D domain-containing protein [Bacteroidales bacterium]